MKGIIRQGCINSSWKQSSAQCYFVLYKWNDQLLKILLIPIKLKQNKQKLNMWYSCKRHKTLFLFHWCLHNEVSTKERKIIAQCINIQDYLLLLSAETQIKALITKWFKGLIYIVFHYKMKICYVTQLIHH